MNVHDMIYPAPIKAMVTGAPIRLDGVFAEGEAKFAIKTFIYATDGIGIKEDKHGNIRLVFDDKIENEEGYSITAVKNSVTVRARSLSGFSYAGSTLALLTQGGYVPAIELYDAPLCKVRGVHMYLPPSDAIDEFLRVIDLLAHLKYNTVFLEIGGGVEYESHPEINKAWKKFCREARDYYGGPQGLQASEAHWKDSTHVELAGGHCLTKSELSEIVSHIRFLGMEVIPEIQALSHAYYLTLAHPEIAEQPFEPYPDTWCPMNEASYRLYEDIATELHDLLGFSKVSVGHDEIRILGKCPRCRKKSGAELLAHDINLLHSIWEKMGVKMFMWGESLQNYINAYGNRAGGKIDRDGRFGRVWQMPATHEAIDMIPTDITMLDWQWGQSIYSTSEFQARGIPFLYGNFHGRSITNWQTLIKNKGFLGAEVSTWCTTDFNELGRNGWFHDFVFSAAVLWEQDYDDDKRAAYMLRANDRMPALRAFLKRNKEKEYMERTLFTSHGEPVEFKPILTSEISTAFSEKFACKLNASIAKDTSIAINNSSPDITVLHAVDFNEENPPAREQTWFFHDKAPLLIGYYSVTYEDGLVYSYPVEYGYTVGDYKCDFAPLSMKQYEKNAEDESGTANVGALIQPAAICGIKDKWIEGVVSFTDAYPVETNDGIRTIYAHTFKNRHTESRIKSIKFYTPMTRDGEDVKCRGTVLIFGVLA